MRRAILCALCIVTVPLIAQQPTFSSKREVVQVDVLVTERGRPVTGLTAADFDVIDSGVPQHIEFASFEQVPLTIALVLDGSASITPERLANLRDGSNAVLETMRRDDQVALIAFGDAVTMKEGLTSDTSRIRTALGGLSASQNLFSGTALIDAAYAAMTVLAGEPGRSLLLAFTDGIDTSSWLRGERVVEIARRSNAVTYGVSTGPIARGSFLRDLSETTGGSMIQIRSTDQVRATFLQILDEFRHRYLVGYSPANVPIDGWHPLTVRVKNRNVEIRARAGYAR